MKSIFKKTLFGIILFGTFMIVHAQGQPKPEVAVLGIDSKGVIQDANAVCYMVILELEKANVYTVMDKYDVADVVNKNNIDVKNCFGKSCVLAAGKLLKVDKMITGSVERFEEKIVISLKIIDVNTEAVERQDATEYLNLQPELQKMIGISVHKLLGIASDQNLENLLVNYDIPVSSPRTQVRLNGPRMGVAYTIGDAGNVLQAPEGEGGFNMFPLMFQIGWQQEWQYLSAGDFQALIEAIPIISGLESGKFIPSVAFLNGFRFGKQGWEIAIGPSFRVVKKADGYYDGSGDWNLGEDPAGIYPTTERLDSRGSYELSTRLILGLGKTFKSGYLNIPVNLYVAPDKQGTVIGFSFGFNIYKKPKVQK